MHTPGTGLDGIQERQGGLVLGVGGGTKKMFTLCCLLMGRSLSLERETGKGGETSSSLTVQEAGENEIVSPRPPPRSVLQAWRRP